MLRSDRGTGVSTMRIEPCVTAPKATPASIAAAKTAGRLTRCMPARERATAAGTAPLPRRVAVRGRRARVIQTVTAADRLRVKKTMPPAACGASGATRRTKDGPREE
ncbi:hypothetical protein GCM10010215_03430 [Streptomyces virginiae]|uniref:Uncharacterized protein n=1 Tax=Streptomyces virginiae TaxID=1961 RepID=A0ABQ3NRJ6_STRVG|nr:hypothetical protein GCM10010215_03430 [Streptomyces virginiae]GHI15396.1 hypothetical protein Scinn_48590 [Streptomyces virginiae]GLV92032.1 hypothetical protein Slala04_34860 [Streptomyces lavendulae subsp. lavendulae]